MVFALLEFHGGWPTVALSGSLTSLAGGVVPAGGGVPAGSGVHEMKTENGEWGGGHCSNKPPPSCSAAAPGLALRPGTPPLPTAHILCRRDSPEDMNSSEKPWTANFVTDRFGFLHKKHLEIERTTKWLKMLKGWEKYKNTEKFHRRIYKGIPLQLRGEVWALLLEIPKMKEETRGLYRRYFLLRKKRGGPQYRQERIARCGVHPSKFLSLKKLLGTWEGNATWRSSRDAGSKDIELFTKFPSELM
ncbi:PREDICTED: uncharacterized protein LOC102855612 [Elephantulus edwardii]|uniref:uncharacterized protein LOC102855612 n=1 Tax=Elephantulus edwardii TaxID=28737 RepID=UPI0003F0E9C3|nr:PREDICTED: uncharacterized protein LOC102855612 [Elephantulus edwardii]